MDPEGCQADGDPSAGGLAPLAWLHGEQPL